MENNSCADNIAGSIADSTAEKRKDKGACRKILRTLILTAGGARNTLGVRGFCEFLETINGDNLEEKKSYKTWARSLGWTGRMPKPENML